MLDDRSAYRLAGPVHELNHVRRQASLEEHLDEYGRRVRDILGGLEHDSVPTHQRGKDLPRWYRERKVEGRDDAGDANGPSKAHRPFIAQLAWHGVAEQSPALRRRIIRRIDSLLYIPARFGQGLPHLPRHEVGDLLLPPDEYVASSADHITSRWGGGAPPPVEPALCRRHRPVDIR